MELHDTLKEIRQSFRLLMNGVTAQSLREKGQDYRINWGASLQHLREMAAEYPQDYDLAAELWKDDVRESKILATMLMPKDSFPVDLALLWIEQTRTQEIAELAVINLYQYQSYAAEIAMRLIASPDDMQQLHGYTLLARLFAKGETLEDRDVSEFLDQAITALQCTSLIVRHSALKAVQKFAETDDMCAQIARSALKSVKMRDWV